VVSLSTGENRRKEGTDPRTSSLQSVESSLYAGKRKEREDSADDRFSWDYEKGGVVVHYRGRKGKKKEKKTASRLPLCLRAGHSPEKRKRGVMQRASASSQKIRHDVALLLLEEEWVN